MFNIGRHYGEVEFFLLLQIKYFFFSCKRLNVPISIIAFNNRLSWVFKSYEYIALKTKNLHSFKKIMVTAHASIQLIASTKANIQALD